MAPPTAAAARRGGRRGRRLPRGGRGGGACGCAAAAAARASGRHVGAGRRGGGGARWLGRLGARAAAPRAPHPPPARPCEPAPGEGEEGDSSVAAHLLEPRRVQPRRREGRAVRVSPAPLADLVARAARAARPARPRPPRRLPRGLERDLLPVRRGAARAGGGVAATAARGCLAGEGPARRSSGGGFPPAGARPLLPAAGPLDVAGAGAARRLAALRPAPVSLPPLPAPRPRRLLYLPGRAGEARAARARLWKAHPRPQLVWSSARLLHHGGLQGSVLLRRPPAAVARGRGGAGAVAAAGAAVTDMGQRWGAGRARDLEAGPRARRW
mmetsp:Transcript_38685/g.116871  ORF Transcript_38685/g.116871 Transcript_38685/m.116871 type:complete len:327 (+) Transcript_38685:1000-1980(+)